MDWAQWSRDAVRLMQQRNEAWSQRHGFDAAKYHWDLHSAQFEFSSPGRSTSADLCLLGTVDAADGTFEWAWANPTLPAAAVSGLDAVPRFGSENDLALLTTPVLQGGVPQGLECAALAGRILDAEGVFVDNNGPLTLFFLLRNFRDTPAHA